MAQKTLMLAQGFEATRAGSASHGASHEASHKASQGTGLRRVGAVELSVDMLVDMLVEDTVDMIDAF